MSHFDQLYELKDFIRSAGAKPLFVFLGAGVLKKWLRSEGLSAPLAAGRTKESALTFFSRLCGQNTTLLTARRGAAAGTRLNHLEQYLMDAKKLAVLNL